MAHYSPYAASNADFVLPVTPSAWLPERKFPESFALRAELRLDQADDLTEEETDLEGILAGSPKLRKMGRDLFRAIEDERRTRGQGIGNGVSAIPTPARVRESAGRGVLRDVDEVIRIRTGDLVA